MTSYAPKGFPRRAGRLNPLTRGTARASAFCDCYTDPVFPARPRRAARARAGKAGITLAFVDGSERNSVRDVERLTRVKLTPVPLPTDFQAQAAKPSAQAQQVQAHGRPSGHGQRRHDEPRGDQPKRRLPPRRKGPVGAHAGAVRRSGGGGGGGARPR